MKGLTGQRMVDGAVFYFINGVELQPFSFFLVCANRPACLASTIPAELHFTNIWQSPGRENKYTSSDPEGCRSTMNPLCLAHVRICSHFCLSFCRHWSAPPLHCFNNEGVVKVWL